MKILLIEDLPDAASEIMATLSDFTTVWITGVLSVERGPDSFRFQCISGEDGRELDVELSEFDLALIDHELEGSFDGASLVRYLRESGVVCVGISAKANLNGEIMASGAHLCVPKHALADQIRWEDIDLKEVVLTYCGTTGTCDDMQAVEEFLRSF